MQSRNLQIDGGKKEEERVKEKIRNRMSGEAERKRRVARGTEEAKGEKERKRERGSKKVGKRNRGRERSEGRAKLFLRI